MRRALAMSVAGALACGGGEDGGTASAGGDDTSGGATCDATVPALESLQLTANGPELRDPLGRVTVLRGVNSGGRSKFPPFFPFPFDESGYPGQEGEPSFAESMRVHHDRIEAWGHSVVRVPFTWEAVEPTPGTYDTTYLDRYAMVLEDLQSRGIRTIVDFHQDVYARFYCGDGFPLWSVPEPHPEFPAVEDCENWSTGYFGNPDVNAGFDRFWANEDGLRDAFLDMWTEVVERTASLDGVIGYEIINEPHYGSEDETAWAQTTLAELYEDTADVIHAADPGTLVFFDNGALDGVDDSTSLRRPEREDLVFAPHYYHQGVFLSGPDDAEYEPDEGIGAWAAQGQTWEMPVLVGEFGVKTSFDGSPDYLDAVWTSIDKFGVSATAWEYSSTMDDWNDEGFGLVAYGGVETPSAETVVRVYPLATAGTPGEFTFDRQARTGSYTWTAEPGHTEIVVPSRLYPDGVEVTVDGVEPACVAHDEPSQRLVVHTLEAGPVTLTFGPPS